MFNGYNETPLISYELNQERTDKKQDNAPKWPYGHDPAVQPPQTHPANRQPEFWSGKPGFVGLSNVVKCSCAGCYPSSENQSYQGDTTRHRPWLPRTFPVPLNGSNEPCKLPPYQWDNGSHNQGSCYPETNVPFVQENGGKHPLYRHYQESNQPGVITSLKNADFAKKQKDEASLQNGRQPVFCNPIYNLTKRADGRNYCDPNEKYSNATSFSVDPHIGRLPVVEPYIKPVPSNLSQNRVPSTGYRSVKENMCQSYPEPGYGDSRKMCGEVELGGEKRSETFPAGALPTGAHVDYSPFGRDLSEAEQQKLFFDTARHSEYYSRKNFQDVINRNTQTVDNRKDCAISQMNLSEQYNFTRGKYQESGKLSCDSFYPKDFDKTRPESHLPENSPCFQRNEDKNENMNIHARLTRSALIFNDPRFAERTQNPFPYQTNPAYRNYARHEYPYQGYNAQHRYDYSPGFQRNDFNQYRVTTQPTQPSDQFIPQQGNGFPFDPQSQQSSEKTAQFYGDKNLPSVILDSLPSDSKKPTFLEPVRSEGMNRNGPSKISPLRLLRRKKFINVPHEPTPAASSLDTAPGLDVRKFWSTWAEEEEENVAPTQMVVLDCQNIDPEQAKLLHLYETDPVRAVQLENGGIVIKGSTCGRAPTEVVPLEDNTAPEVTALELKNDPPTSTENKKEASKGETNLMPSEEPTKTAVADSVPEITSPPKTKSLKQPGFENRGGKKCKVMDKWTEKKFDFLKRSEESKAAEILRHEEEKKKIFETRLTLQQSLKKIEKPQVYKQDEKMSESMSPFDENSQSSSPDNRSGDGSNLPTSEYRRNKFLDYSDKKVTMNGTEESDVNEKPVEPVEVDDVKKENLKLERGYSSEKLFPPVDGKLKEEPCFEMDDILQKISEINFQNRETKLENGTEGVIAKKMRHPAKKVKRKKSDHQSETDQRSDKLTLETVKFSIQKSHDLKISFKVLNNSKKCSDEETGNKDTEVKGSPVEDSKNSTELITLSYKSIQRDGDRRQPSESKKNRRRFRRKSEVLDEKTPVLKIKKSRYMPQTERDPLGTYEDEASEKPYSEGYPLSDDFHVHETVDSAKIKLTFKRHKANFETKYKINSNSLADPSELEPICEELEDIEKTVKNRCQKKPKRSKESDIFTDAGVESFQDNAQTTCSVNSDTESISREAGFVSNLEDDAKNSVTSRDSFTEEENYLLPSTPIEPDVKLSPPTFQNDELPFEGENDNSTPSKENPDEIKGTDFSNRKKTEPDDADEGNDFSLLGCNDENWKESTSGEEESREKERESEREEISEISLDFIKSTNAEEIETNREPGKTEEREKNNMESSEENGDSSKEINHSEVLESSYESKSEGGDSGDLWKETSAGEIQGNGFGNETDPEKASESPLPVFACENDDIKNCISCDDRGNVICEDDLNEVSSDVEKPVEPESVEERPPEESNDNANSSQGEPEESARFEAPSSGDDTVEDLPKNETVEIDRPTTNEDSNPQSDCEKYESSIPEMVENSECELNSQYEQNCDEASKPEDCSHFEISRYSPSAEIVRTNSEAFSSSTSPNIDAVNRDVAEKHNVEGNDISFSENVTEASVDFFKVQPEDDEMTENSIEETIPGEPLAKTSDTPAPSPCINILANIVSSEAESSSNAVKKTANDLPLSDTELEEGEIVDSSDDENPSEIGESLDKLDNKKELRKYVEFVCRKIERRNSVGVTGEPQWRKGKFSKAESCPPAVRFTEEHKSTKIVSPEDIKIEEIPLPLGPPPRISCFDFKKFINSTRDKSSHAEAKEKAKESISPEPLQVKRKELDSESPSRMTDPQKDQNPVCLAETAPPLGIFQRSSKIKFSISKRSRFPKIDLNSTKRPNPEVLPTPKVEKEPDKKDTDCGYKVNKESTPIGPASDDQNPVPAECQSEQVPNQNVAKETEKPVSSNEEPEKLATEHSGELLTEDLRENIEEIRAMSDCMRDEFYECEDIPTSEDLTNGDDPENEKVNDDKFRNIMQNCLDNAKKFLNVGNLKLFSCSVDDLLELDCQVPDSTVDEPQANHISRDVLLTACEDTNDELALEKNVQPPDFSMDFVPSFCSDVCPEILPVDNWPYLEEEVPSSPTKPSQDETDLIPSLETAHSNNALNTADNHHQFHSKNGIDRRKRVISESCFKRFRRRSLISESESVRMCSKIGTQRRNTVDSLNGVTCGKEIRDIQSELLRWKVKKDEEEKQSLKCRLSLEKLRSKHGVNFKFKSARMKRISEESERGEKWKSFDYKSPTWQPKVMLLRISKHELRKLRRDSKLQKRSDPGKRVISSELENQHVPVVKKPKTGLDVEEVYLNLERDYKEVYTSHQNEERFVGLPGLESIKGSLSVISPTDDRKRKKRFRNLHKKRKSDPELERDVEAPAQKFASAAPATIDAEAALTELFKDCDCVPSPQMKHTKDFKVVEPKKISSESMSGAGQMDISKREEKSVDTTRHSYNHKEHKHRDKMRKSHRERRKERAEEYNKHKDRHRDSEKGRSRHGSSHHQHDRSKHSDGEEMDSSKGKSRNKSRSNSGGEPAVEGQKEESSWCCEVCGFNDAEERISHIKSHPFHCQSCHLAFKTEAYFVNHLTKKHKDIRNQHHCLLCELSFDTEEQYQRHMETREHRHLESVEKNTINTLFTILTGAPCPVLGLMEMKPEWLPNQAGTVHFYHQATPLSLALQYLKMHDNLTSFSTVSSAHPN